MQERQADLLRIIVEEFIRSGQPVASTVLVQKYQLNCSSATVRNMMVELVELGYLSQPHTSAGRVPLSKAFRHYVESSIPERRVPKRVRLELIHLNQQTREFSFILQQLVHRIARLTSQIALASFGDSVYVSGWANLVESLIQSEDIRTVKQLLSLLEDREKIARLFSLADENQDVQFFIGDENPFEELHECTFAVTNYHRDNIAGIFGVMGPVAMNYPRVLGTLHFFSEMINQSC